MATIGSIKIRIGGDISSLQRSLKKAERSLQRSGRKLTEMGNRLSAAITLPVLAIGAASLKTAGDFEALEKGMESMMGSAEAAKAEIALLRKEALKPGLNFEQALKGSVRLQAVQVDAELARRALAGFGNAIALVGGTGEQLDGVTLALSQIAAKGKISAEEINQLAERVPQIRQILKDGFGTADTEELQKLGIGFEEFVSTAIVELEKLPRAQSGIKNSIENTKLALQEASAIIGKKLFPTFEKISKQVLRIVTAFTKLDDGLQDNIIKYALIGAAIGPVLIAFGQLKLLLGGVVGAFTTVIGFSKSTISIFGSLAATTSRLYVAFGQLSFAMKALSLSGVLIAVTAAIAGFVALKRKLDEIRFGSSELAKVNATLAEAQKQVAQEAGKEIRVLDTAIGVLKDDTASRVDKKKAIAKLLEQHPNYLKNIDLETAGVKELNKIQEKLNENILKSVGARKKAEVLDQFYGKIIDKQLQLQKVQKEGVSALGFVDQFTTDPFGFFRENGETGEEFAVRKAVEGLNTEITDLKNEANLTANAFDNLFKIGLKDSSRGKRSRGIGGRNEDGSRIKEPEDLTTKKFIRTPKEKEEKRKLGGANFDSLGSLDLIPDQIASIGNHATEFFEQRDFTLKFRAHIDSVGKSFTRLQAKFNETTTAFKEGVGQILESGIENGLASIGDSIGDVISGAGDKVSILGSLLSVVADALGQLGKLAISTGVAMEGIRKAFSNPFAAIAAGVGLIALSKFVKNKAQSLVAPKLAKGGLAYGETLATVGDNFNAAVDPEVIAPLSKLKDILAGTMQNLMPNTSFDFDTNKMNQLRANLQPAGTGNISLDGEFRILGTDLVLAVERSTNNAIRVTG